jgi:hypothetical protein
VGTEHNFGELDHDVFGNEENAAIKYKTLSWPLVAVLMIAEIVSNGMLSLPAATAVVGIVPGVILIAFLGACCCCQSCQCLPHARNMQASQKKCPLVGLTVSRFLI